MTFPTKKVKICGLKSAFIFSLKKTQKLLTFSFYNVEKNVETVYDSPHDAYYRS